MLKISKIFAAGFISIALAGCATTSPTTIVTKQVNFAVVPPTTLYNCPQVRTFPNPATLTNEQLATLITTLVKNNKVCGINMASIKDYVAKAKAQIEANK